MKALISKTMIDSYISHDEFALVDNVSADYNDIKGAVKNSQTSLIDGLSSHS